MNARLALRLCVVLSSSLLAGRTFERHYGSAADESGVCLLPMPDGGFVVAGGIESMPGFGAVVVVRVDSLGDPGWTTVQTEPGAAVSVFSGVAREPDRLAVAGSIKGTRNDRDMYAACVDTSGNRLWSWSSGLADVEDVATAICPSPNGGWVVCGHTLEAGQYDLKLVRLNFRGDPVWSRRLGMSAADFGYAVAPLSEGGFLAAGATYPAGSRYTDGYLVRVDDTGAVVWSRSYGGAIWDEVRAVTELASNRFILAGFSSSFGTGMDVWLQGVDSTGQGLWMRSFGNSESDRAFAIDATADGGLAVAGETYVGGAAEAYLARTDDEGRTFWQRWYGDTGYDCGRAVAALPDSGFAIAGQLWVDSLSRADCFLVRTDRLGSIALAEDETQRAGQTLRAWPNPFSRSLGVWSSSGAAIRTADGRLVRAVPAGSSRWDGRDATGVPVRDGVYFVAGRGGVLKVVRQRGQR